MFICLFFSLEMLTEHVYLFIFQSRDVDRTKKEEVKEANKYFFIEATLALIVSLIINIFVTSIFAEGFYGTTASKIVSILNLIQIYLQLLTPK